MYVCMYVQLIHYTCHCEHACTELLRDQSDYIHNITGILATYSETDKLVDTISEQHYVFGGDGINYKCLCQNSGSVQGVYVTYNVCMFTIYSGTSKYRHLWDKLKVF